MTWSVIAPLLNVEDESRMAWECPEDGDVVAGYGPERAEEAVREHFKRMPHAHVSLAGFTVAGPVIQGHAR